MRPAEERREIADGLLRGLYFIVQPSGAKSWAVRYRHGGRTRKYTVGPYPLIDLKAAREAGAKALRAAAEGRDPAHEKKPTADSVESAVNQFIERHVKRNYRPGPLKEAERLLRLHVVDRWRGRKISEISRADVRNMLDRMVDHAPIAANRVHSIVRKLFNWCLEQEIIAVSPCLGLRPPAPETSRDRVLSDHELGLVWQAAQRLGVPFGSIVQLLILTGQRRGEVAQMQWAELDIDKRLWTLPRERTKNDRRHEVPLSPQAIAVLKGLPRISDQFVFSLNGTKPVNGFGKNSDRLKALVPSDVPAWVIHDLRRTVASGLARLGIGLSVIEKVLNHVSGSFAGIVGVYQRHEFAEEKRAALDSWAKHVDQLVRP
jgi:integrase